MLHTCPLDSSIFSCSLFRRISTVENLQSAPAVRRTKKIRQPGGHNNHYLTWRHDYFTFWSLYRRSIYTLCFGSIQFCWTFLYSRWRLLLGFRSRCFLIILYFKMLLFTLLLLVWGNVRLVPQTLEMSCTQKTRTCTDSLLIQLDILSNQLVITMLQMTLPLTKQET